MYNTKMLLVDDGTKQRKANDIDCLAYIGHQLESGAISEHRLKKDYKFNNQELCLCREINKAIEDGFDIKDITEEYFQIVSFN